MDIEKAKKDYEMIKRSLNKRRLRPCGYCNGDKCMPQNSECLKYDFVINTALDAIEKQIPKKPTFEKSWIGFMNFCPCCKQSVGKYNDRYCGFCGQRIDWGEYE